MVRIKRGNVAKKRRKKIFSIAKGFRGAHSKIFRIANEQVMKSLRYGYIGRKRKKMRLDHFEHQRAFTANHPKLILIKKI